MEEQSVKANINKQALLYGVIVGVIYVVLQTFANLMVGTVMTYSITKIIGYLLYMTAIILFTTQIKKSSGGYMDFKTAFRCILIMILVAELFFLIYFRIYQLYIDPQFLEKMKESVLTSLSSRKMSQEIIDKTSAGFDEQIADMHVINIKNTLWYYCEYVILDGIVGLIAAAIVKKEKPAQMA